MLQACLSEPRDKSFNGAVPCTARELAANGNAVVEAGAHELHVHPRDRAARRFASAMETCLGSIPTVAAAVNLPPIRLECCCSGGRGNTCVSEQS
jgi:uncharacterized protein (DUF849 family)